MDDAMYQRLLPVFVTEAERQLDEIGDAILVLARDSRAEAPRTQLAHAAHAIRGKAASLGLRQIVIEARHLEQCAARPAQGGFSPSALARLHEARAELRQLLAEISTDARPSLS